MDPNNKKFIKELTGGAKQGFQPEKANKEERAKLWRKQYYQNKKKLEKEQDERVMIIIKNIVENNISTL
jgi:hypothetical protein